MKLMPKVVDQQMYDAMVEAVFASLADKILAAYEKNRSQMAYTVFNSIELAARMKGAWGTQVLPYLLDIMERQGLLKRLRSPRPSEEIGALVRYRVVVDIPYLEATGMYYHKIIDIKSFQKYGKQLDRYRAATVTPAMGLQAIGMESKIRPEGRKRRQRVAVE